MCFEFVHPCDGAIIDQFNMLVGADSYFMFCIGHLNYVYCTDNTAIDKMKGLLFMNGLVLHPISEQDLIIAIEVADTIEFQAFHGSKTLYILFRQRNEGMLA